MSKSILLALLVLLSSVALHAQYDLRFVKNVQFYVDEKPVGPLYEGPFTDRAALNLTYGWDATKVTDGKHLVTVVAFDIAGNRYPVAPPTNILVDNTKPLLAITADNRPVVEGMAMSGKVNLMVGASDATTWVTRIELWINGAMVRTSTVPASSTTGATPIVYSWNTSPLKRTSPYIQAVASDKAGNLTITRVQVAVR